MTDDQTTGAATPAPEGEAPEIAKPAPYKVNQLQTKSGESGLTKRESE